MNEIKTFRKILVANRGEIAIRVCRAAHELGIRTVAIYSHEDRFALHRFKADEAYEVGSGGDPVKAYLDIETIVALAKAKGVDAIHPGYGFLSENPELARSCARNGITFIGPSPEILEMLGNKTSAKVVAEACQVPVLSGNLKPLTGVTEAAEVAAKLGFPVILKAANGGGGRGMRVVRSASEVDGKFAECQRESLSAFNSDEIFVEKFLEAARHIEVQILADGHGRTFHLYERDCSLQRRHQKIVEIAPSLNLPAETRDAICTAAVKICKSVGYFCAGTVEFLLDASTGKFYFIEINPRIQVEHTVTEMVTGVDLVKAQILVAMGHGMDHEDISLDKQEDVKLLGHAFQCRITTEDPENSFIPDYGRILNYRSPGGLGIRLDAGSAFSGAVVTPYYDSMLVKVTAFGRSFRDATVRMERALAEFRVRGVKTNIPFLVNLIAHTDFTAGKCTTRFIDSNPELFHFPKRRDRATRVLRYLGDIAVNGHPHIKEKPKTIVRRPAPVPHFALGEKPPEGSRDRLLKMGASDFCQSIRNQKKLLITDTTMRDAHQSLLATRMRTYDMHQVAESYAHRHSELFSVEMWGGATFDTSMRFLRECPWERLRRLRKACPNILFQMLLRSANAVGYANYPDNVVRAFIRQAAASGIDVFRIFDSLNWVENMKMSIEETLKTGAICEPAICYTGDILDPKRSKFSLEYYVKMARQLEGLGAHMVAIKDMAGLLKPYAAFELVSALKAELKIPIHLHTHDTSGGQLATLIKAAEAGVDVVDTAFGPFSGLTSQANLNTLVEMMRFTERDTGMDYDKLQATSDYWEVVREYYAPFETGQKFSAADVYRHEMPGGQYTNLYQQANSLGLGPRWRDVCEAYAQVNKLFGDIVKVTPSSKVVGDMALFMVTNDLKPAAVLDPSRPLSVPKSVVEMMEGLLGQPDGGFPKEIQDRILSGRPAFTERPGAVLVPVDLELAKENLEKRIGRSVSNEDLQSSLMYPEIFAEYAEHLREFDSVSVLPTPVFFYGLPANEEVAIEIEEGKTLIIKLVAVSPVNDDGNSTVFFELNGQPRELSVPSRKAGVVHSGRRQANSDKPFEIGAPMPGMVVNVRVTAGQKVLKGDPLVTMEAMKMESTIYADRDGTIAEVVVKNKESVKARDLIFVWQA